MFKFFSLLLISVSYLFADNPNPSSFDDFDLIVVDQDANEVVIQKLPKAPNGKKIKNVEVFINLKN